MRHHGEVRRQEKEVSVDDDDMKKWPWQLFGCTGPCLDFGFGRMPDLLTKNVPLLALPVLWTVKEEGFVDDAVLASLSDEYIASIRRQIQLPGMSPASVAFAEVLLTEIALKNRDRYVCASV